MSEGTAAGDAVIDPQVVAATFKAYDVRGLAGEQITETLAAATGRAFVEELAVGEVVVGHDMRPSSPGLAAAFARGASGAGASVTMIGLASTDQLYFASGALGMAGAMFTASHNPAQYNGIKMCRAGAVPVGQDTGLSALADRVSGAADPGPGDDHRISERDVLEDYAAYLRSLAPVEGRRLTVVVDAGNGMAGHTAPAVLGALDLDVIEMFYELDGTFPNHEANPIDPSTLVELQARVREEGADVGLAFDGDADRCFLVDETGALVDPSVLTALIADRELQREPGSVIIHNLITSRAVPEIVAELGGTAVRTRVGHSFIKARMADTDAVFGGEHSGHFYFRDFWRADSGMLAALHTLAALAETDRPLSALLESYSRYVASGEINSTVSDAPAIMAELEESYADEGEIDHLDGLTVTTADWWFNVRPSNTEPLLRLNCEGSDQATMERVRDAVLAVIRRDA